MTGNQQGFTLVELLVALTIFAIGLLSIAGMQVVALRGNASAYTLTAATSLAEGILEETLAWPADDARLLADAAGVDWDFDPATAGTQTTREVAGAGTYSATYDVDVDYNGIDNVVMITVTVTGSAGTRTLGGAAARQVSLVGFRRGA